MLVVSINNNDYLIKSLLSPIVILLKDHFNQIFVEKVVHLRSKNEEECDTNSVEKSPKLVKPTANGLFVEVGELTFFESKKVRYIWEDASNKFLKVDGLDKGIECSYYHELDGLSHSQQVER